MSYAIETLKFRLEMKTATLDQCEREGLSAPVSRLRDETTDLRRAIAILESAEGMDKLDALQPATEAE